MEKLIERNIELTDIENVNLMCSLESSEKICNLLKRNVDIHRGKSKILNDAYLTISCLTYCYDEKLKLDGIRIKTIDGEIINISTYEVIDNQIIINDNVVRLVLNVSKYIGKQEKPSIKVLDYSTLDYNDYEKEEVAKTKRK